MISFFLLMRLFWRAVRTAWSRPEFRALTTTTLMLLTLGTVFYHQVEGWSWLDSFYFCVITLATVGYGDFSPKTPGGKIFTIGYIFLGIGLLVAFFTQLANALVQAQQEAEATRQQRRLRQRSIGRRDTDEPQAPNNAAIADAAADTNPVPTEGD